MMKLTHLALSALASLPVGLTAQTQATSAIQTQAANDHHADEAAIQQVMNRYHAAIQAHDGTAFADCSCPMPTSGSTFCQTLLMRERRRSRQVPRKSASATIATLRSCSPRQRKTSTLNTATS